MPREAGYRPDRHGDREPDVGSPSPPAPALLPDDPSTVGLGEPFTVQVAGGDHVVAAWCLIPKPTENGRWFAHFWLGPGSHTWLGSRGQVPSEAARFPTREAVAVALAAEPPSWLITLRPGSMTGSAATEGVEPSHG